LSKTALGLSSQFSDLLRALNVINLNCYLTPSVSSNLTLSSQSGVLFAEGINADVNSKDPLSKSFLGTSIESFRIRTQTGGATSPVTLLTPTVYDNAGIITAIAGSNNQATNMYAYKQRNGNVVIQLGQFIYSSLDNALVGLANEKFIKFANLEDAILINVITITKGCTNTDDTVTCRIKNADKFGYLLGGGGSGINLSLYELLANKQNSLAVDGTGIKYATVDAINAKGFINKQVLSITSSTTPTFSVAGFDETYYDITALAGNIASFGSNITGTPPNRAKLMVSFTDNGTARTLGFLSTLFNFSTYLQAPVSTTISKTLYLEGIYNSTTSKYDVINWQDGY